MNLSDDIIRKLIEKAERARENAYAPYSGFLVGSAVLGKDGSIYTGCNIENVSFSATNCAERTAVFKGVSEGCLSFDAVAVVGGRKDEGTVFCYPCGICRQVLAEFSETEKLTVIIAKSVSEYKITTLDKLMPHAFAEY